MSRDALAHHWITPLALVPFGLMLVVHRSLGLSDAALAAPKPGEPYWPLFNFGMILAFYLGVAGYLAHTIWLADRGRVWVVGKCVLLAAAWTGMLVA